MRLILVSDDGGEIHAIRDALAEGDVLDVVSPSGLVDAATALSIHGRDIVEQATTADGVLLSWNLPEAPALNTLSHALRVRHAGPSISICDPADGSAALAGGADAVLGRPFRRSMMQALILAHRRLLQVGRIAGSVMDESTSIGPVTLHPSTLGVEMNGQTVVMTPREFALMRFLAANHGRVCPREALLDNVWDIRFDTGTNMVDVYVYFLRRKLEGIGLPGVIETIRSVGYRLRLPGVPAKD